MLRQGIPSNWRAQQSSMNSSVCIASNLITLPSDVFEDTEGAPTFKFPSMTKSTQMAKYLIVPHFEVEKIIHQHDNWILSWFPIKEVTFFLDFSSKLEIKIFFTIHHLTSTHSSVPRGRPTRRKKKKNKSNTTLNEKWKIVSKSKNISPLQSFTLNLLNSAVFLMGEFYYSYLAGTL